MKIFNHFVYKKAMKVRKQTVCCSLFIIAFAAAVTSCSDEEYLGGHSTTAGAGVATTITAAAPDGANWPAGMRIGISASNATHDVSVRNREYVSETGSSSFVQASGNPIYVKGNISIVGYYPFTGTDGAEPVIILNTADQNDVTEYYFAKTDGVTLANGTQVNLNFHHALARMQVAIEAPAGESIKQVRVSGFSQQAEVDPFTLGMKLSSPEDLVVTGDNMQNVTLWLIPQTVDTDAPLPAQMTFVGTIRSYTVDLGSVTLNSGDQLQASVNVTDGISTFEFVPVGSQWENSGLGGDYSFNQ